MGNTKALGGSYRIDIGIQRCGIKEAGVGHIDTGVDNTNPGTFTTHTFSAGDSRSVPNRVRANVFRAYIRVDLIDFVNIDFLNFRKLAKHSSFFNTHLGRKTVEQNIIAIEHFEFTAQEGFGFGDKSIQFAVDVIKVSNSFWGFEVQFATIGASRHGEERIAALIGCQ